MVTFFKKPFVEIAVQDGSHFCLVFKSRVLWINQTAARGKKPAPAVDGQRIGKNRYFIPLGIFRPQKKN